jgi:DHA2 family methylenomycin A resistance protein-like MFS transporter
VFGINIPVCSAMLALLAKVATSPTRPVPFDWAGQILGVIALAGVTFGLIEGGAHGFGSLLVFITLAVAVMSLVGFVTSKAGLQTSLMVAAVLLLATVAISIRIRPTDHQRRLSSSQPKEKH